MKPDSPMSGSAGKLHADKVIQLPLAPYPHRNQQLFSDHYLNIILPKREDWQMTAVEAEPVMRDLQRLFANYTPSDKEAQVEDDFLQAPLGVPCTPRRTPTRPACRFPDRRASPALSLRYTSLRMA